MFFYLHLNINLWFFCSAGQSYIAGINYEEDIIPVVRNEKAKLAIIKIKIYLKKKSEQVFFLDLKRYKKLEEKWSTQCMYEILAFLPVSVFLNVLNE